MATTSPATVGGLARVGPGYTSAQLDSKGERNRINEAMRGSDLWRNAIKAMGLNPDGALKLSKAQQKSLAQTLQLPTSDFHVDGAGNINDYHGWKGLPTAAKVAIGVGAAVATGGAGGMFSGAPGAFGIGTGAAGGLTATEAATAAAYGGGTTASTVAAAPALVAGGNVAAASHSFWSPSTLKLLELGVGTGTSLYANHAAAGADRDRAAHDDDAAARALAFLEHQDELDRQQYGEERARLWGLQDVDRARAEEDRQLGLRREGERDARLAPLRGGSGAFATLNDLAGLRPSGGGGGRASAPAPSPVRATDWDGAYATGGSPRGEPDDWSGGAGAIHPHGNPPNGAADDGHTYTMPDGTTVPYIPFHNPYGSGGPPRDNYSNGDMPPFSTTMPVGRRRPPLTIADLATYSGQRA